MKRTIKVIDGQIYMPIVPNGEQNTERKDCFNMHETLFILEAVQARLNSCMDKLEKAISDKQVFAVAEYGVFYNGGHFGMGAYNGMQKFLEDSEHYSELHFADLHGSDLLMQLIKACAAYDKEGIDKKYIIDVLFEALMCKVSA